MLPREPTKSLTWWLLTVVIVYYLTSCSPNVHLKVLKRKKKIDFKNLQNNQLMLQIGGPSRNRYSRNRYEFCSAPSKICSRPAALSILPLR